MDDPTTIARLGVDCQRLFGVLIETLDLAKGGHFQNVLSCEAVEEELGRFRIWATNIGALNTGRASLDYRVKDAEYLQQNVKSLLEDLKESLDEGLSPLELPLSDMLAASLVSGDSDNKSLRRHDNSSSETESDISLDSEWLHSVKSKASYRRPDEVSPNPLQGYHDEVVSIVDKLFDVSILIRGSSPNFRASRAAAHGEKDPERNDLLTEFKSIVSPRIAGLCPETPTWLVQRLTNVIAMQRQQFYYQRAHKNRLARISTVFPRNLRSRRDRRHHRNRLRMSLSRRLNRKCP
jgi:hypothetical protein